MVEVDWVRETARPQSMVLHFQGTSTTRTKVGRRKLRLFACACCRAIWDHIPDAALRDTVEVAERFADGLTTKKELESASFSRGVRMRYFLTDQREAKADTADAMVLSTVESSPFTAAFDMTIFPLPLAGYRGDPPEANSHICDLLRDIFGNPFRPVAFDPPWRTTTAVQLARRMYESRDFGPMPILADALQDAGCEHPDVLAHCRGGGPHVRGCWVVDLVLGNA